MTATNPVLSDPNVPQCPLCYTEFPDWYEFDLVDDWVEVYSCPRCKKLLCLYESPEVLRNFEPDIDGDRVEAVVCKTQHKPIFKYVPPPPDHAPFVAWFVYCDSHGEVFAYKGEEEDERWDRVEHHAYQGKGNRPQVNIPRTDKTPKGKTRYWQPYLYKVIRLAWDEEFADAPKKVVMHKGDDRTKHGMEDTETGTHSENTSGFHEARRKGELRDDRPFAVQISVGLKNRIASLYGVRGDSLHRCIAEILTKHVKELEGKRDSQT